MWHPEYRSIGTFKSLWTTEFLCIWATALNICTINFLARKKYNFTACAFSCTFKWFPIWELINILEFSMVKRRVFGSNNYAELSKLIPSFLLWYCDYFCQIIKEFASLSPERKITTSSVTQFQGLIKYALHILREIACKLSKCIRKYP